MYPLRGVKFEDRSAIWPHWSAVGRLSKTALGVAKGLRAPTARTIVGGGSNSPLPSSARRVCQSSLRPPWVYGRAGMPPAGRVIRGQHDLVW